MVPSNPPQRAQLYARIAGVAYLIIIIAGIYAEFFVRGSLIVPNDAAATAGNILNSQLLFRTGLAGDLVMLICDVIVAVLFYHLLKSVNQVIALLATVFRLVNVAIYGATLVNLALVLILLGDSGVAASFQPSQTHTSASMFLAAQQYGYALALVFFGVYCVLLGYLLFKSEMFPGLLGILMVIAGAGYLLDSFAHLLLENYADYESILIMAVFIPAFVGELALTSWLLVKGVRTTAIAQA